MKTLKWLCGFLGAMLAAIAFLSFFACLFLFVRSGITHIELLWGAGVALILFLVLFLLFGNFKSSWDEIQQS